MMARSSRSPVAKLRNSDQEALAASAIQTSSCSRFRGSHQSHKPLDQVSQANQVRTSALEYLQIGLLLLRELFLLAHKQPNRLMGFVAAKWRRLG
jgi:hypothetical protein